MRRVKNIFDGGGVVHWALWEVRRSAVVDRWFHGEGVGECGCVREYAGFSVQPAR